MKDEEDTGTRGRGDTAKQREPGSGDVGLTPDDLVQLLSHPAPGILLIVSPCRRVPVSCSSFILHPSSFQFPLRSLRDGVNMRAIDYEKESAFS